MLQKGMICQVDPETLNRAYSACLVIVKEKIDEADVLCVLIQRGDRTSSFTEEVRIAYEDLEPVTSFPIWFPDNVFTEEEVKNKSPLQGFESF